MEMDRYRYEITEIVVDFKLNVYKELKEKIKKIIN